VTLARLLRHDKRIRTLGVDDGPFERGSRGQVLVVGAVYAGDQFEGLLSTRVRQDGHNATRRLIEMIAGSKFQPQLHLVLLDGITLGGFNVVDLPGLAAEIGVPCLAVTRRRPDQAAIRRALSRLPRSAARARLIDRAGAVSRAGRVYFQACGIDPELAALALERCTVSGNMPEALRAAHLIARGIVTGESGRRA
jgi:endonuclease V-like protein UPF0215 family